MVEAVCTNDQTSAQWLGYCKELEAVEWQLVNGPNDGVLLLGDVKRDGCDGTRVANGIDTPNSLSERGEKGEGGGRGLTQTRTET